MRGIKLTPAVFGIYYTCYLNIIEQGHASKPTYIYANKIYQFVQSLSSHRFIFNPGFSGSERMLQPKRLQTCYEHHKTYK